MIVRWLRSLVPASVRIVLKRHWYRGTRHECPLCQSSISYFLPLEPQFRNDLTINGSMYSYRDYETLNVDAYLCPVCGASDRARLFSLFLKTPDAVPSEPDSRFVHFAPDHPLVRAWVLQAGFTEYRTSDLFMSGVDDRLDIQDLHGYDNESVSAFLCSHVLEHVPNDSLALKELHRVLHPKGWGIVMVPVLLLLGETHECPEPSSVQERITQVGQADHVRVYAKNSLVSSLRAVGFETRLLTVKHLGQESVTKYGLSPTSTLYLVTRAERFRRVE